MIGQRSSLLLFLQLLPLMARANEVCCPDLPCFNRNPPFNHMPLPNCPEDIRISMRVFTQANPEDGQVVTRSSIPPAYKGEKRTVFIVHGWLGSRDNNWMRRMKDDILTEFDYNVVVVGWDEGSQLLWYPQSASDTRAVGGEIGLVAQQFIDRGDAAPERLWCVGHSLGSHICGQAGNIAHFGRITGLDPAGPYFERREETVGLNPSCADYVDVIHTNGIAGIILNLGTMNVLGHADFYPHGGDRQPGCILDPRMRARTFPDLDEPSTKDNDWLPACSHNRVIPLFRESILTPCFHVRQANCQDQYRLPETCETFDEPVQTMGFHSDAWEMRGIFYIETEASSPYCQN